MVRLSVLLLCTALSAPVYAAVSLAGSADGSGAAANEAPLHDPATLASDEGVVSESAGDVVIDVARVVTSGDNEPAIFGRSTGGSVTITSGEARTSGNDSTGIFGESLSTTDDVTIDSGLVVTTGAGSGGIVAHATGSVAQSPYGPIAIGNAIVTSGSVITSGDDATGISAVADASAAIVDSSAVTTSGDRSIGIAAAGGAIARVVSGTVTTSGVDAIGISAQSKNGAVVVDSGTIVTTGDGGTGINATGAGPVVVTSASIVTSGDPVATEVTPSYTIYGPAAAGIAATSERSDVIVSSGEIRTGGLQATGIAASAFGGITITSDLIETAGFAAKGIEAFAQTGPVTIDSGVIDTGGDIAEGINVIAELGRVNITSGTITTAGDFSDGIQVVAGGSITIDSGSVSTTGGYSSAINSDTSAGDVTIASGSIVTTGENASGIAAVARSPGGDVAIQASTIDTASLGADAIYAYAGGSISVTADTLHTRGERATGVFATAYDAIQVDVDSIVTEGALSAGISAVAYGGSVDIAVGSVATSGDSSVGVYGGGLGDVTITAGTVVTSGDRLVRTDPYTGGSIYYDTPSAIAAYSYSGDIVVTADTVSTSGYGAIGITTYAVFGTSTITAGSVVSSGDLGAGIRARGGTGATVIADQVHTTGFGIDAGAASGEAVVRVNDVTTSQDRAEGVAIVSLFGSGLIEAGTVATEGDYSSAIRMLVGGQPGYSGNGAVISGSVSTSGDHSRGIWSEVYIDAASVVSGSVTTSGYDSAGILVEAGGDATVTSGSVATSGTISDGIAATSQLTPFGGDPGAVAITSQSVVTSGDSSRGIVGIAPGDVTIVSGAVATRGETAIVSRYELVVDYNGYYNYELVTGPGPRPTGIYANSSDGAVSITSAAVTTAGIEAHGVHAITTDGGIAIAVGDVAVRGQAANAVRAQSGSGDIAISVAGTVTAATAPAIFAETGGVVDLTVASGGLLSAAGGNPALLVNAASADLRVAAGGTLRGAVRLTGGDDSVEVDGLFDAIGDSAFGAGADGLTNRGQFRAMSGTVRLLGLEQFANQGLINFADGAANDVLDLSGTQFVGGSGSAVRFDLIAGLDGALAADRLILGAVSGVTAVQFNPSGTATLGSQAQIIVSDQTISNGAFVLDPDFADAGFLRYKLVAGDRSIAVTTTPDVEVFEAAKLGAIASGFWRHGAEAWSTQTLHERDSGDRDRRGVWGQAFAGNDTLDRRTLRSDFGGETFDQTLATSENFRGLQIGGDVATGPLRVGVTAGYGDSDTRLRGTGNRIDVKGFNLGLDVGWSRGAWFANALAKVDRVTLTLDARSASVRREANATIFGAAAEAGLRLGGGGWFAEPLVGLAWSTGRLGDFTVAQGRFEIADATSATAKAGLRVGGAWTLGQGYQLRPSAGVYALKELAGENRVTFRSGGSSLDIADVAGRLFARAEAGVSLTASGGFEAFLRGSSDIGDDRSGAAGRAGLNWRW